MRELSIEYGVLVFLAVIGILQWAVVPGKLKGMSFFRKRTYNYIFAAVFVAAPLVALSTWNYRNEVGIVQGSEQAGLFMISMVAGVLVTLVISSLINYSRLNRSGTNTEGLEALKTMTYFQSLAQLFRRRK